MSLPFRKRMNPISHLRTSLYYLLQEKKRKTETENENRKSCPRRKHVGIDLEQNLIGSDDIEVWALQHLVQGVDEALHIYGAIE